MRNLYKKGLYFLDYKIKNKHKTYKHKFFKTQRYKNYNKSQEFKKLFLLFFIIPAKSCPKKPPPALVAYYLPPMR